MSYYIPFIRVVDLKDDSLVVAQGNTARISRPAGNILKELTKNSGTSISRSSIDDIAGTCSQEVKNILEVFAGTASIQDKNEDFSNINPYLFIEDEIFDTYKNEILESVKGLNVVQISQGMSRESSSTLNVILQMNYNPRVLADFHWDRPTVYAYALSGQVTIEPAWWANSGRPCHICSRRAVISRKSADQNSAAHLEIATGILPVKNQISAASIYNGLGSAYSVATVCAYINSITKHKYAGLHPSRYLHRNSISTGQEQKVLVPSYLDCDCQMHPGDAFERLLQEKEGF